MTKRAGIWTTYLRNGSVALAALCAAATTTAETPATAPGDTVDITGSWVFQTGVYNQACTIRGRMRINPPNADGVQTCHFVTYENCPGLSAEVTQSCTLKVTNGQAAIVAKIESFEKQEPFAYSYAPDDWLLTIESHDQMIGTLESASRARAVFTRQEAPVS